MPTSTTARLKRAVHRNTSTSAMALERLFTLWFRGFVYTHLDSVLRLGLPETRPSLAHEIIRFPAATPISQKSPKRVAQTVDDTHQAPFLTSALLKMRAAPGDLPDFEWWVLRSGGSESGSRAA